MSTIVRVALSSLFALSTIMATGCASIGDMRSDVSNNGDTKLIQLEKAMTAFMDRPVPQGKQAWKVSLPRFIPEAKKAKDEPPFAKGFTWTNRYFYSDLPPVKQAIDEATQDVTAYCDHLGGGFYSKKNNSRDSKGNPNGYTIEMFCEDRREDKLHFLARIRNYTAYQWLDFFGYVSLEPNSMMPHTVFSDLGYQPYSQRVAMEKRASAAEALAQQIREENEARLKEERAMEQSLRIMQIAQKFMGPKKIGDTICTTSNVFGYVEDISPDGVKLKVRIKGKGLNSYPESEMLLDDGKSNKTWRYEPRDEIQWLTASKVGVCNIQAAL